VTEYSLKKSEIIIKQMNKNDLSWQRIERAFGGAGDVDVANETSPTTLYVCQQSSLKHVVLDFSYA
jgi:hypothetical protein